MWRMLFRWKTRLKHSPLRSAWKIGTRIHLQLSLFRFDFPAQQLFQFARQFQFLRPVIQIVFVQGIRLHGNHTRGIAKLSI
jgi:hypothetical protein